MKNATRTPANLTKCHSESKGTPRAGPAKPSRASENRPPGRGSGHPKCRREATALAKELGFT
eukprot:8947792-Pyramimonas_sp.AAC.1